MDSLLSTLRQNAPRITASRFLAMQPGCFVQYYDDTPAHNPAKALSAPTFDPATARRKQRDRCAIGFSLHAFDESRTAAGLLCFRTMGIDVDLVAATERASLPPDDIDHRKETYLTTVLAHFPLRPQWLIETRHGFHVLFRVQPQRMPQDVRQAHALHHRLVRVLQGDPNAVLLTQLARVPGTLQFKIPTEPFLCRLLVDDASTFPPYPLDEVEAAVLSAERLLGLSSSASPQPQTRPIVPRWREGLGGVPEGVRNVTAASLVGKIVGRLPEELWETAGWGGLKEWNARNQHPLTEQELRAVFVSITHRERGRRPMGTPDPLPPAA